jgi:hypothetical protein
MLFFKVFKVIYDGIPGGILQVICKAYTGKGTEVIPDQAGQGIIIIPMGDPKFPNRNRRKIKIKCLRIIQFILKLSRTGI